MNVGYGKVYLNLRVADVSRPVSYRLLDVRWISVRQFDAHYSLPEHTFFACLDFYYKPQRQKAIGLTLTP
jgi:hypothetical protein